MTSHQQSVTTADWLAILDYGTFQVAEDGRVIPILGFVVVSGDDVILVDTGFPDDYVEDPAAAGRRDGLDAFGRLVEIGTRNRPEAQLELVGLSARDVTTVVLTHGDIDHIGAADRFSHSVFVAGRAEVETGPPRYFGDARPVDWPRTARYRLTDGDEEVAAGVVLLSTPGHSPGHRSVLVRLRESGTIVLAADAISRARELETGVNGGADDPELARDSARRLVELAGREGALLVYGHDPAQRSTLRMAPQTYC